MSGNGGTSSDGLATVGFLTGVDASGRLNTLTYWRWAQDIPATYTYSGLASDGSAHKWGGGAAGTAGTVRYYFDPGSNWSAAEQTAFKSAMALWSAVANVTFTRVDTLAAANTVYYRQSSTTSPLPPNVTLTKGMTFVDSDYTAGAPGATSLPATQSAYMTMDTAKDGWRDITSFTYWGGYAIGTVVHELGHIIGVGHAGPYNATVNAALQQYNPTDTALWSLMSYLDPTDQTAKYYSSYPVTGTNWLLDQGYTPTTFMPLDILAAQRLYGAPATTALNNVTFGFNCTIVGDCKPFFDFTVNTMPVITLYATGLANTLDVSSWSTPSTINLNPGTFSSVDGMTNNLGLAYGTRIDTAFGGNGDDTFIVNANADTINGGGGLNTAQFGGTFSSYTTAIDNAGVITVALDGVTDTLTNIYTLKFTDQALCVPTVTGGGGPVFIPSGTSTVRLPRGELSIGINTNQAFLARLYQGVLARPADFFGLSGWTQALGTQSFSSVASGVLGSPEYQAAYGALSDSAFVANLYTNTLGRSGEPAGMADWTQRLASGATRADVAVGFAQSPEAQQYWSTVTAQGVFAYDPQAAIVRAAYQTAFGRDAEVAGLTGWTSALHGGLSLTDFANAIANTPEFLALHASQSNADMVASFYLNGLGRPEDAPGAAGWNAALAAGASRGSIVAGFAASTEGLQHLSWTG